MRADATGAHPYQHPYQYVVLRCVPRVDREEFCNVGVVLYCESTGLLDVGEHLDPARLSALAPDLDLARLEAALGFVAAVCRGDQTVAGAAASVRAGERFGFLKAPRSTILQPGPVHGGCADDPAAELVRLVDRLVR